MSKSKPQLTVRLPDFKGSPCQFVSACAELQDADQALVRWMKNQKKVLSARYRAEGGPARARLFFGGRKDRHVHFDLARKGFFLGRRKPPKPLNKMSDIQDALGRVIGREIDAELVGEYLVDLPHAPLIISAAQITVNEGNVSIKTTGGRLLVQGAPISTIDWSMTDADTKVRVVLTTRKVMKITESYMLESLELLDSAYKAFILEGAQDAGSDGN